MEAANEAISIAITYLRKFKIKCFLKRQQLIKITPIH